MGTCRHWAGLSEAALSPGSLASSPSWPLLLASLPAVPAAPYNVGCVQLTGFLSLLPGGDSPSTGDTHVAACQQWHRIK